MSDTDSTLPTISAASTDAMSAMPAPYISGCVEIDGPPVAWFCDGQDDIEYTQLSLSLNDVGSMENLILEMDAKIQKIRNRSNVILWRSRPRLTFRYIGTEDNPRKGLKYDRFYPEKEDYEQGAATIQASCRLACYPPLTDAEARRATNWIGDSLISPTTQTPTGDHISETNRGKSDGLAIKLDGIIGENNQARMRAFFCALFVPGRCDVQFSKGEDIDGNPTTKLTVKVEPALPNEDFDGPNLIP